MNEMTTTGSLLTFIERAARDPAFDVSKFSVLLDRQEALMRQKQLAEFNTAYAKVQREVKPAEKSGQNPVFRNPYAKLEDLDKAARAIYSEHGFNIRFGAQDHPTPKWMYVTLTLSHEGGHSETQRLAGPIDEARNRTAIQAVGSTVTYLRRYLLMMVLNLVATNDPSDNDGNAIPVDHDPQTGEVLDPVEKVTTSNKQVLSSAELGDRLLAKLGEIKKVKQLFEYWELRKPVYDGLDDVDKDRVGKEFERVANVLREGGS